jgi:hypothetical protein
MPRYARETTVPVERCRAEIEEALRSYGASEFHSERKDGHALVDFHLSTKSGDLLIRFILPIPSATERRFTHYFDKRTRCERQRTKASQMKEHEQEVRQRWRALQMTLKAKLEAAECGISTIEQEFLAFIVMPEGVTVGGWMVRECLPQMREGQMPQLCRHPATPVGS